MKKEFINMLLFNGNPLLTKSNKFTQVYNSH
jgi:hypothetical protein